MGSRYMSAHLLFLQTRACDYCRPRGAIGDFWNGCMRNPKCYIAYESFNRGQWFKGLEEMGEENVRER